VKIDILADWSAEGKSGKWWVVSFSVPHPKSNADIVLVSGDKEFKIGAKGLAEAKKWAVDNFSAYEAKVRKQEETIANAKPTKRTRRTAEQVRQDNFVLYD
jgi:hypothetical protein